MGVINHSYASGTTMNLEVMPGSGSLMLGALSLSTVRYG